MLSANVSKRTSDSDTSSKPKIQLYTHIDYLRMTHQGLNGDFFSRILSFICEHYTIDMDVPWSPGGGAVWFPHRVRGIEGFVGGFRVEENGTYTLMYQLPGEYWINKSAVYQWRMLRGLGNFFTATCNRIDLAIDDSTFEIIPLLQMLDSYERGEGMYFKKRSLSSHQDTFESSKVNTWYFGSRRSNKMHRIYKHSDDCFRHECEFKGAYANSIFSSLIGLERPKIKIPDFEKPSGYDIRWVGDAVWEKEVQRTMASLIVSQIDFRERTRKKDKMHAGVKESVRCVFWDEYINKLNAYSFKVKPLVPKPSLQRTLAWIKRQCSATLAMLKEGVGVVKFLAWMHELTELGSMRMDSIKMFWASYLQKHPKAIDFSSA